VLRRDDVRPVEYFLRISSVIVGSVAENSVLSFSIFQSVWSKRVNLLPINRSGIPSNSWNFPLMQIFLIIYHWNTLNHFDCVLRPVVAFQRCALAVCADYRQAIVAFAYDTSNFHTDYLSSFFVNQCRPDDERNDCQCGSRSRCPIFSWLQSEQMPRRDEIMRLKSVFWRRSLFMRDGATIYISIAYLTKYIIQELPEVVFRRVQKIAKCDY